jgi:hypothetical protein
MHVGLLAGHDLSRAAVIQRIGNLKVEVIAQQASAVVETVAVD